MRFQSPQKFIPKKHFHSSLVVAGCDEAGRGPWAGPVVTAAVILPPRVKLPGLNDSKLLNEQNRERLFELITKKCIYSVGISDSKEIDAVGLGRATKNAFLKALTKLKEQPTYILIDGREKFPFILPYTSVIKGDSKLRCIAAASIVAKVTRDRMMKKFSLKHPEYQFCKHKGYGTRLHQQLIQKHGICEIHRKSFTPIAAYLES